MPDFQLIPADHREAWDAAVALCRPRDSYHLAGYHLVAEGQGEGEPYLLVFAHGGRHAALPLLRRPVAGVDGLSACREWDAVSAYGYPGAITSARPGEPGAAEFRDRFQEALREAARRLQVVSLFVRQNPLIDTGWLLAPLAEVKPLGRTVALDLQRPEAEQWSHFRSNHRRDVRRLRRDGVVVDEDSDFQHIDRFRRIYRETMDQVGAADYYYFSREYFVNLKEKLGDAVTLCFARRQGQVLGGALFLRGDKIIQYHLGARAPDSPPARGALKLIFDEMRVRGAAEGWRWLHLGGGTGSREDSLFHFKAGFSDVRPTFCTAGLVFEPAVYRELVIRRRRWMSRRGLEASAGDFFPEYRRAPCPARAA